MGAGCGGEGGADVTSHIGFINSSRVKKEAYRPTPTPDILCRKPTTQQPVEGFALLPLAPIAPVGWTSVYSGSRGRMGLPWLFIMM